MDVVAAAVQGDVTIVQLKEKSGNTRDFVVLARQIKNVLPVKVPLIINDRIDIALGIGADVETASVLGGVIYTHIFP